MVSPIPRIQGSRIKGWKGNSSLTVIPDEPLGKCLLPVSVILSSSVLEVLFPEIGELLPGYTQNIPLNWKLTLPSHWPHWLSDTLRPTG